MTSVEGVSYLFENWTEKQDQKLSKKPLIQGDIGTLVFDVGGIKWTSTIVSPVIIIETVGMNNDHLTNVFDLLIESYNVARSKNVGILNPDYVLQNAVIDIQEESVRCTLTYVSAIPGAFSPKQFGIANFDLGLPENIIGRTVRNYDTIFYTDELLGFDTYVQNGKIEINFDIKEHYFFNVSSYQSTAQYPYFSVQGYQVKGYVNVAIKPDQYDDMYIAAQTPGFLNKGANSGYLAIANGANSPAVLNFGSLRMHSSIEKTMKAGDVATMSISFESFTGQNV